MILQDSDWFFHVPLFSLSCNGYFTIISLRQRQAAILSWRRSILVSSHDRAQFFSWNRIVVCFLFCAILYSSLSLSLYLLSTYVSQTLNTQANSLMCSTRIIMEVTKSSKIAFDGCFAIKNERRNASRIIGQYFHFVYSWRNQIGCADTRSSCRVKK